MGRCWSGCHQQVRQQGADARSLISPAMRLSCSRYRAQCHAIPPPLTTAWNCLVDAAVGHRSAVLWNGNVVCCCSLAAGAPHALGSSPENLAISCSTATTGSSAADNWQLLNSSYGVLEFLAQDPAAASTETAQPSTEQLRGEHVWRQLGALTKRFTFIHNTAAGSGQRLATQCGSLATQPDLPKICALLPRTQLTASPSMGLYTAHLLSLSLTMPTHTCCCQLYSASDLAAEVCFCGHHHCRAPATKFMAGAVC